MKVLIVNPIIYTSETSDIKRADTVKDTMIYDLCLGFKEKGADVTLAAAEDYKPVKEEKYPFKIVWFETSKSRLFPVNTFPLCKGLGKFVSKNKFDLIITSEVFSVNSLILTIKSRKNLIVWHELAKHNRLMHGIPSKIWYNIIARIFFKNTKIVARSEEAKQFISRFCKNVSDVIIDHGVNLDKFTFCEEKENCFAVSSQLIERKRIDKILYCFADYIKYDDAQSRLYIMGDGEEKERLEALSAELGLQDSVIFTGRLHHDRLVEILSRAQAMLVYTEKDNNMVSIVESIALGTPVITTSVPYNAAYIQKYGLGIVDDNWDRHAMASLAGDKKYIQSCLSYRKTLSTAERADAFFDVAKTL